MEKMKGSLEIDRELDSISRQISFDEINPVNSEEERLRFFQRIGRGQSYNPVFRYKRKGAGRRGIRERLAQIEPDSSVVGRLLAGIRDTYLLDLDLVESIGSSSLQGISIKLHGSPGQALVEEAQRLVFLKTVPEKKIYRTKEIIQKLRIAFFKYGVTWTVEEKDMIANAAVRVSEKKLLLRKHSFFSKSFLKRIIVHEIGTHIVRAENGRAQPYLFFRRGLPGYLRTEEGLAVVNEERNRCLNNAVLKVYAGRVLAVRTAMQAGFCDTYREMRRYFGRNTAWRLALRVKRGLIDTSREGAFTKDIAYLQGYLELKDYIRKGKSLTKLYYGKVGTEHVGMLDRIDGLTDPHMLPMLRYLSFIEDHFRGLLGPLSFDEIRPVRFSDFSL